MKFPDIKKIVAGISDHPMVDNLLIWAMGRSLPGFYKIPIYDVIAFLIEELKKHDLVIRANSMAFSFFLSLFPAIIMTFTLVAYFPVFENFSELLRSEILSIMPNRAGEYLFKRIEDIATSQQGGLLSLSFILAIYFSSNGIRAMMRGFEKSYFQTFKTRSFVQKHLISFRLTALLGLLLIASVLLILLGTFMIDLLIDYTSIGEWLRLGVQLLRWLSLLGLLYFGIAVIYRYGAATRQKIRWFSPGATLATVLSLIASLLFSFYVDNFGRYNELYGPLGAIIVLMLWLQINSFSLLVGFELNASIAVNRDMKIVVEESEDEEDGNENRPLVKEKKKVVYRPETDKGVVPKNID